MIKGIWTSAAGMCPRMFRQEIAANNLANVTTTGFKKERAYFKSMLDAELMAEKDRDKYSRLLEIEQVMTNYSQGLLEETHNPLDLAIVGDGFFAIQTPQGEMYTRNGNFKIDARSRLVTSENMVALDDRNRPIYITEGKVFINEAGEVSIDDRIVGKLKIRDFPQPYQLQKAANSLFTPINNTVVSSPATMYKVRHGFLERSNVQPVEEMLNMIVYFRNYEADSRILMAQDDTLRRAVNDVGRVS
ncbi:flagellar hook-basal body protein [bacterium]|nr:flagellar hook-basal body protein [FCB group bacterium]MBL7190153.1 flagellar hook-basal body protein [bacterium]